MEEQAKENERVARLEVQLESLNQTIDRVETKIDLLTGTFLTRNEAEYRIKTLDKRIENIEEEMNEQSNNKRTNISIFISALSLIATTVVSIISLII